MKKLLKNPLFYVMYFIPQLIMTHAVSTFNKTFSKRIFKRHKSFICMARKKYM